MCKLSRLLLCGCLGLTMNGIAVACDSTYDPVTGVATIGCMDIPGDARSFDAFLRGTGGDTFVLIGSVDFTVRAPRVTGLQILRSAFHVAVISGVYPDGCWSAYKPPTVTQTGPEIEIRVSARALNRPESLCAPTPVPFVQAVVISPAGDAAAQTYFVNGVRMIPTF